MAEKEILDWMDDTFSVDYPWKGMLFAGATKQRRLMSGNCLEFYALTIRHKVPLPL